MVREEWLGVRRVERFRLRTKSPVSPSDLVYWVVKVKTRIGFFLPFVLVPVR